MSVPPATSPAPGVGKVINFSREKISPFALHFTVPYRTG